MCLVFLAAIAGVLNAQPAAQQFPQPPATNAVLMQSSVADLIKSLKLHKPNPNNPIEKDIDATAHSLPIGDVQIAGVWICNGCGGAFSHPDLGIVLDTAQLDFVSTHAHVESPHVMLVFAVAHEVAHQVQYAKYGRGLMLLPEEDRRYYEAQADVLAGIWLYQDAGVLPVALAADNHTVSEALHAVYNLGVEQYALASHPSKEARAFATRTGFQIGLTRRPILGDAFQNAANSAVTLRQNGMKPGESDLDFSLRLARRITSFNSVAALDLVRVVSQDDLVWDTSSTNPQVTYRLTYANRGAKALHVSLEALCLASSRKDSEDFFQTLQVSSKYHDFDIPAGGQTTITGQLRWLSTADRMPSLRTPPDDLGLVEVHYADGSDSLAVPASATPLRYAEASEPLPTNADGYATSFTQFLEWSLRGYTTIRKGPGLFFSETRVTEYGATDAVPGAIESKVQFGVQSLTGITSTLLRTTDAQIASSLFQTTIGLVRTALQGTLVPHSTGGWTEYPPDDADSDYRSFSFRSSPYTVRVQLIRQQEGGGQGTAPATYYYVKVEWMGLRKPG